MLHNHYCIHRLPRSTSNVDASGKYLFLISSSLSLSVKVHFQIRFVQKSVSACIVSIQENSVDIMGIIIYRHQIQSIPCYPAADSQESAAAIPFLFYLSIPIIFSISSSTVPIPLIPKFSTRIFATLGLKNAGSVGPR